MMKVVALYKRPDDVDSFMQHYRDVHMPLVEKVPGLTKLEVSRVTGDPFGGEPPYFLMAVMSYPDKATYKTAMRSPENQAVGRDVMGFARDLVTAIVCEDVE